ncbi:hypothetical protein JHK87_049244 [Glycine soja]|nr:hypothetical protein JHK87_049244 [Glycine soja]
MKCVTSFKNSRALKGLLAGWGGLGLASNLIARKIRTKVAWTTSCSGDRKPNVGEAEKVLSPASVSGEASSCLSSSSSGISSERSLRYAKRCRGAIVSVAGINRETAAAAKRRGAGSPHLHRRGEAILKLLSCCGGSSEVKIRQMLGDSPDTSKALRMYNLSVSHSFSHTQIVACNINFYEI